MGYTLALALGMARCALSYQARGAQPQALHLPDLSAPDGCIPTVLCVQPDGAVRIGQAALPCIESRRCFQRLPQSPLVQPEPAPRQLDDTTWDTRMVGQAFMKALFRALPFAQNQIDRLIVSMPHFENAHSATRYARWLHESLAALDIPEARIQLMSELDAVALSSGLWSAQLPVIFLRAEPEAEIFEVSFAYLAAPTQLSVRLDQVLREGVPFASLMTERCSPQTFSDALADCLAYAAEQGLYPSDLGYFALSASEAMPRLFQASDQAWSAHAVLSSGERAIADGLLRTPPYLQNSYGLRYRAENGEYAYIELAPSGTPFPSALRTVHLAAAYDDQPMLEFVIGMLDPEAKGQITLNAASVPLSYTLEPSELGAIALNEFAPPLRIAIPQPVRAAEPCLEARFYLDSQRRLCLTATDLRTGQLLAENAVITTLH
ncbi:MAG: hypothetical protein CUN50_04645 [Candidatus Thermofonsia Clade 1 bacterium]|uniref:Uncharacterized protein n=1 Tax=Candidatus Thermofonsia Clade 1 bacterium TaxID=2364210 RepID=A0A2M8PXL7_9CHLR|nr:MAG: hypothetical protein CUN50_04645 [Candidatus Thermofonsia Clade 1 bacterium]